MLSSLFSAMTEQFPNRTFVLTPMVPELTFSPVSIAVAVAAESEPCLSAL